MTINPQAVEWLQARAIDPETASRMGIYTAGRGPDGEPRPNPAGNILVFPYIEGGSEVNAKYRTLAKSGFWQRKDARKTFFNADVLDDPALERGDHALVITEGELDTLAAIQSGFPFTVSVPDGAPPRARRTGQPRRRAGRRRRCRARARREVPLHLQQLAAAGEGQALHPGD